MACESSHSSETHTLQTAVLCSITYFLMSLCRNTHAHLTAIFPGLPGWVGTRKVKPIWILLKQEIVSGSDICWATCKSAPCFTQITTSAPPPLRFLQAGCHSCHPTNSVKALKHCVGSLILEVHDSSRVALAVGNGFCCTLWQSWLNLYIAIVVLHNYRMEARLCIVLAATCWQTESRGGTIHVGIWSESWRGDVLNWTELLLLLLLSLLTICIFVE